MSPASAARRRRHALAHSRRLASAALAVALHAVWAWSVAGRAPTAARLQQTPGAVAPRPMGGATLVWQLVPTPADETPAADALPVPASPRVRPLDDARAPIRSPSDAPAAAPATTNLPASAPTAEMAASEPPPSFAPRRLPAIAGVPDDDGAAGDIRRSIARSLRDAGADPFPLSPADGGALVYDSAELAARIHADGSIDIEEKPPFALGGFLSGSGDPYALPSFDLNGPLLRLAGEDPTAPQKSCLLDATRDLRIARRTAADQARLSDSLRALEATMADLWRAPRTPDEDKRRALFELWDECRDDDTGAAARALIVEFIRRELPHGSPRGYTPAELSALNRRRTSTAMFAPYAS